MQRENRFSSEGVLLIGRFYTELRNACASLAAGLRTRAKSIMFLGPAACCRGSIFRELDGTWKRLSSCSSGCFSGQEQQSAASAWDALVRQVRVFRQLTSCHSPDSAPILNQNATRGRKARDLEDASPPNCVWEKLTVRSFCETPEE